MEFYRIIKRVARCRSSRLRLLMLWGARVMGRRSVGVYIDPVLACNLRCRMCAFSDAGQKARLHGRMSDSEIESVANGFFCDALKVQIGCAAEPTLDRRVGDIIKLAKESGVPYVSLTTNGQLLTAEMLDQYARAGLDEITLSVHGTEPEMYEWLMSGASFGRFMEAIDIIRDVKNRFRLLRLRVNFTVNADNAGQLPKLLDLFGSGLIDILQVRPVQCLGATAYDNFDLSTVREAYADLFVPLAERCRREGVECLMPSETDIDAVAAPRSKRERMFEEITYCYAGPGSLYASDYDAEKDTFRSYHSRRRTWWRVLRSALIPSVGGAVENDSTKKLNYR